MPAWDHQRAADIVGQLHTLPGALLPILHALQDEFGYVDHSVIPAIADALNISKAEVHGTITFYHDFRSTPPGAHKLYLCRAESCQSMGCTELIEHVEKKLGAHLGETTKDGSFTLNAIYCLGNCANSPAMMLDGQPYGRVTTQTARSDSG
ncbi:MAG: formate dehydrogenase subunit gamma [Acidobacteriota bacterium]